VNFSLKNISRKLDTLTKIVEASGWGIAAY
jgi:hypothetical protein